MKNIKTNLFNPVEKCNVFHTAVQERICKPIGSIKRDTKEAMNPQINLHMSTSYDSHSFQGKIIIHLIILPNQKKKKLETVLKKKLRVDRDSDEQQ